MTPPYPRADPYGPTQVTPRHGRPEPTAPSAPFPPSYDPAEVTTPYGRTEPSAPYRAEPPSGYRRTEASAPYAPTDASAPYAPTDASSPYGPTQASGPQAPPRDMPPRDMPPRDAPPPHDASGRPQDLVRYGPGVPPSEVPAAMTAEHVWRTGRPEKPARRPPRWRRLAGTALTVILLAASGVLLYLRFHHAPFHVSAAAITTSTPNNCGVNVTGRIDTNGAAGTVDYEWVFQPDQNPPQPLKQSVVSGQHSVFVNVAVQGSGHGTASQKVTLQVLGPDRASDSKSVVVSCG